MDLGLGRIAGALQRAGEAELGRWVHGIDAYGFAIFVGGFGEVLALEIAGAEEVVGVGGGWVELDDLFKGRDAGFAVALGALEQAEVVPDAGIGGVDFGGAVEFGFGLGQMLQNELDDACIHVGDGERGVGGDGELELREGVFALLLVHVGNAEVVGADHGGGK